MTLDSTGAGSAQVDAPSLGESWVAICTMDEPVSFTLSTGGHVIAYGSAGQSASFVVASGQAITVKVTGGTASSTLCGTITGTTGKGEPPPLVYAQSRGGAAIDLNPEDIAYEFLGISPASVGKVTGLAAPASHVHPMGKTSSRAIGFGLMQTIYYGGAFVTAEMDLPTVHTMEGWLDLSGEPTNGYWGMFDPDTSVNFPSPSSVVYGLTTKGVGPGSSAWEWLEPDGISVIVTGITAGLHHVAISSDGTTMRFFLDGVIQLSVPAQAVPAGLLFGAWYEYFNGGANTSLTMDEFRLSSVCRYTADFSVPTAPFTPDAGTLGLWHMDDSPPGTWYEGYLSSETPPSPLAYPLATSGPYGYSNALLDSSGHGLDLNLSVSLGGGGVGTSPEPTSIVSAPSSISANSGVANFTGGVVTLQARSGALVLTDTAGNSVATPVPQTDGTIQLQMAALSAGATPWTSIPYWLLRVD